jgi:hypothetical protein
MSRIAEEPREAFQDYRDIVITDLSDENLVLRARVADLEGANVTVRELLSLALTRLHDATVRERHLTRRVRALTQSPRDLRPAA